MKSLIEGFLYKEATLDDEAEIKTLLKWGLEDNEGLSLPIRPTPKSICNFFGLEIRPPLINFDPAFLAYRDDEEDNRPIGFSCASTCINEIYDLPEKVGLGVITITAKPYRRLGIATRMRELSLKALKEKGCEKVLTDISKSNEASIAGCENIAKDNGFQYNIISNKYECKI